MAKLWSAASVKCFGGGVDAGRFLCQVERLVGEYRRPTVSTFVARGQAVHQLADGARPDP
jgi:hypothetical protein